MSESAATREPGSAQGPVDASWLILQRLDDLRRAQDDLRRAQDDLRTEMKDLRAEVRSEIDNLRTDLERKIESVRSWSLGLLLLAILGLLAKLLLPVG